MKSQMLGNQQEVLKKLAIDNPIDFKKYVKSK